ncbi:gfo/Idh/MocA family oxidoreductase, partial [Halomonas sp. MG34]|nr:gfo/Idh/MocA family oxidoreductase [Halomonas sp. MG34]
MNFAIIGCGFIAKKHAKAIQEVENANLVAVSDKLSSAMQPYVEEYGAEAYESLDEMLLREDIDVVSVCTPTGLHAPLAIKVANSKKHVI